MKEGRIAFSFNHLANAARAPAVRLRPPNKTARSRSVLHQERPRGEVIERRLPDVSPGHKTAVCCTSFGLSMRFFRCSRGRASEKGDDAASFRGHPLASSSYLRPSRLPDALLSRTSLSRAASADGGVHGRIIFMSTAEQSHDVLVKARSRHAQTADRQAR